MSDRITRMESRTRVMRRARISCTRNLRENENAHAFDEVARDGDTEDVKLFCGHNVRSLFRKRIEGRNTCLHCG